MNILSLVERPVDIGELQSASSEGGRRMVGGREKVFYGGYWVKTYPLPADSIQAKKTLIQALTRRIFNHTEHGLNVPGARLSEIRAAYDGETDPARRRVKAGMLAGALVNRATDIFCRLVDLEADGVEIQPGFHLLKECGHCLLEALELGRQVLHRSGEEGIDELWGEPFRAYSLSIEEFYETRYVKIAQCMGDIERIADAMAMNLGAVPMFDGIQALIGDFAKAARDKCETLRTDPDIFDIWSFFVTAGECLTGFVPSGKPRPRKGEGRSAPHGVADGLRLIHLGHDLIFYVVRARTPMPKSTREYIEKLVFYREHGRLP